MAVAGTLTGAGASAALIPNVATVTHPLSWVVLGCGLAIVAIGFVSTSAWAQRSTQTVRNHLAEN